MHNAAGVETGWVFPLPFFAQCIYFSSKENSGCAFYHYRLYNWVL